MRRRITHVPKLKVLWAAFNTDSTCLQHIAGAFAITRSFACEISKEHIPKGTEAIIQDRKQTFADMFSRAVLSVIFARVHGELAEYRRAISWTKKVSHGPPKGLSTTHQRLDTRKT